MARGRRAASTAAAAQPRARRGQRVKKTKAEKYHDEMRKLVSFLHGGRIYAPGHTWTRRELLAITPEKIMRYCKRKIYGDEDADPDEDPPVHHRRNSVLYWKKAWSYFMLDRDGCPPRSGVPEPA